MDTKFAKYIRNQGSKTKRAKWRSGEIYILTNEESTVVKWFALLTRNQMVGGSSPTRWDSCLS